MSQSAEKVKFSDSAGYVGFANLPNQVHRKSVKKGLRKSGVQEHVSVSRKSKEKIERTVQIEASTVEIEERGVKLRLTVVDTPGYGDAINSQNWRHIVDNRVHCCFYFISPFGHGLKPLDVEFMKAIHGKASVPFAVIGSNQLIEVKGKKIRGRLYPWGVVEVENPEHNDFLKLRTMLVYLHDESGLNRRHIVDNRVHCCFYFISPFGHGLKPLDVEFMKAIHGKVLDEISEHGIRIYQLPDADSDEDEEFKEQTRVLKASVPFAVIGSNQLIEVKGKKIRGRLYPWGVVEVENPEHNDFLKLRTMLDTHARSPRSNPGFALRKLPIERLKRTGKPAEEEVMDKDRILQQKEAENRVELL
ncbi:hypothetical protein E2320_012662 [Naja naja]|nr:hypothetical protein E2320_012662 [Naja naja]